MSTDEPTRTDEASDHDHDHAKPAPAPAPAARKPGGDALADSFARAREADHDIVASREAAKWFTFTMLGIAVYAAVVIGWIYL